MPGWQLAVLLLRVQYCTDNYLFTTVSDVLPTGFVGQIPNAGMPFLDRFRYTQLHLKNR